MKIELGVFQPIAAHQTLLIASDGLWDNLTRSEVVEQIRTGDLQKQTARLIQTAKKRMEMDGGKPDDLTVICWRSH